MLQHNFPETSFLKVLDPLGQVSIVGTNRARAVRGTNSYDTYKPHSNTSCPHD